MQFMKKAESMNKIYTHPGQFEMQVEVIMASKATADHPPIYTIRMRYPRIIHGEIMTHRMFSRNARSSRAVPVKTMLNEVRNTPFVPWHFGKNQGGMQADEECNEPVQIEINNIYYNNVSREEAWIYNCDTSASVAEAFMLAGYHKQIPNRLLEPFSWIDTLITSTNWSNFLWLRDHKDAEPHLQDLARLVAQAIDEAEFQELGDRQWHLPYITSEDWDVCHLLVKKEPGRRAYVHEANALLCKISAARCARISYKPFDGDASYDREIERYDMLVKADRVHASPLEHQATPDRFDPDYPNTNTWENPDMHGNFSGWIQARKLVPNEAY
jgi:hypothetical protein